MSEVEKCPKCGEEMATGEVTRDVRILKKGDLVGDKIYAFYCRGCGFIELYKEPSTKEPWRLPEPQEIPLEEKEKPKEEQPLTEKPKKRLIR